MFPLRKVSAMLRYRKYAYREFLNGERARRRGIAAPIPYGYFHARWLGLVQGSGLITNDLTGYKDISQLSEEKGDFLAAATLAIPAIVAQYNAGIYHGDFRDANLMIAPGSTDGSDYSLIDWQYASYVKPRQEWLLEHLCAFFITKSPRKHQETLLREGLARVHTAAQPDIPLIVLQQRVERLMRKKMSTRRRLQLTPA
jgi:RIO-like serine/threonine protein kinase